MYKVSKTVFITPTTLTTHTQERQSMTHLERGWKKIIQFLQFQRKTISDKVARGIDTNRLIITIIIIITIMITMITRIIMESYAVPKLSKYMTALGAYNVKSFTYEINQHTHTSTHTPHTRPHVRTLTHARTHKHVVRNLYWGKYVRETREEGWKLC